MKNNENQIPWYSDEAGFFGEHYFNIVNIVPVNEDTPNQCDFLEKVLDLKKGSKILDLCCGHGRITTELAKRGYNMTGQDINNYFLDIAGNKAREESLNINYVKSDMRKIPFKNEFDAVLNMFTSFGFFGSDEEDEKVIAEINKALKPGGKFLMDYVNKDFIIRRAKTEDTRQIKDGYVKIKRIYDHLKCSHHELFDIYQNDVFIKRVETDFRFYAASELARMLKVNGFKILKVFGGFDYSPLSFDSKGCIIIAEKISGV